MWSCWPHTHAPLFWLIKPFSDYACLSLSVSPSYRAEKISFSNKSFSRLPSALSTCLYIFLLRSFRKNSVTFQKVCIFPVKLRPLCIQIGSLSACLDLQVQLSAWPLPPSLALCLSCTVNLSF